MSDRNLYITCPLCDSQNTQYLLRCDCSKHALYDPKISSTIQWMKCNDCSHIYTDGYFTEDVCKIIFGKSHKNQVVGELIEQNRPISSKMVEKILPFVSSGVWLDVGFGNASLLFTAQEYGFIPVGIDLREENVAALNSPNIQSYCTDISDLKIPQKASVISMSDVLEHMPFPKVGLASANKILHSGGALLISMPNTENMIWEVMNRQNCNPYWGELEHYHNFSRTRLYKLLEEFGFTIMRYGISERYRVCMEVVAVKSSELP